MEKKINIQVYALFTKERLQIARSILVNRLYAFQLCTHKYFQNAAMFKVYFLVKLETYIFQKYFRGNEPEH